MMRISIIYESKTGNTKAIAESINEASKKDNSVTLQSVEQALNESEISEDVDLYFLGSWTNKGDAGDSIKELCSKLHGQKIAIFGTAGFGGAEASDYFKSLAERFESAIPEDNEILGYFYSQGKMPEGVRDRYVSMLTKNPEDAKLQVSIENFDSAQSHPDGDDLKNAAEFANDILDSYNK